MPDLTHPGLTLGNSDMATPGQTIVALGSPLGVPEVATVGHVATTERDLSEQVPGSPPALFVDINIHPGSSGGPVLNLLGEVLGVARGTLSQDGAGLNYVVPVNALRELIARMG